MSPIATPRVSPPRRALAAAPPARVAVACGLIAAALVLAVGIFHVSRQKQILALGYRLAAARHELRLLREDNRRLRVEQSVLTSPDRIERLASSLGMLRPTPEQIRV